ncbi:MAG: hypothetical protein ACKVS8_13320 [Phycisphaerales bacterium]
MKNVHCCAWIGVAALAAVAGSASAQTTVSIGPGGTSTSQNFDSLATTGSGVAWSNNPAATVPGWSVFKSLGAGTANTRNATLTAQTTYNTGAGASNAGNLYSFGTGTSMDRALGTIGSGTPGDWLMVFAVTNNTTLTINKFTLDYALEQWREGGQGGTPGSPVVGTQHRLVLDYKIVNGIMAGSDTDASFTTGYTAPGGLWDGVGPVLTTATTGAAVDGNVAGLAAGRGGMSPDFINWLPGQTLVIRWWDDNNTGNDHGLALDTVTLTIPTPGTAALLGIGGLIATRRRRA